MRISSVYALCHLMILNTCRLKEEIHVAPKKERRDRNERRRESRGRRKERPQTIQSHSIFEQGPADSVRKTGAHPQPSSHSVGCLSPDFLFIALNQCFCLQAGMLLHTCRSLPPLLSANCSRKRGKRQRRKRKMRYSVNFSEMM